MMGRRNEKLRRSLLTALGVVVLVAAPILVSAREAFAAPEKPIAEETEAPREAGGADGAKAHREKGAEKASEKSAEKGAEKSAEKGAEKASEKSAEKGAEKAGEKKSPAKAEKNRKKARKKKAASKDDRAAKPERRKASKKVKTKKAQAKPRRESAEGDLAAPVSAPTSERGGILLNKPGVDNKSAPGEESAIKKASTTLKEAAQEGLAVLRASVMSKVPAAEKKAPGAEKKAPGAEKKASGAEKKAPGAEKKASDKPAAGPTKTAGVSGGAKEPAAGPTKSVSRGAAEPPAAKDTSGKIASEKAKKTSKKASSRSKGSRRRESREKNGDGGAKESSRRPCFGPAVTVDRAGLEPEHFPLVDCSGEPLAEARERLSLLARPWGVSRPEPSSDRLRPRGAKTHSPRRVDPLDVAPGVRRMDSGLLARLDAVARKFPGKVISLVSGYRPQSRGSLHQSARAIDLRVAGVANEELAAFCRTLPDTGCGYYPNSSFVHMDVRVPGTGSVSWIDASGPGEPPRYVTKWPPPPEPAEASSPATTPSDAASEPPFNPPPNGDATEMGHDLGASGKPSVKAGAADTSGASSASGATDVKPTLLFEDPPY